MKGVQPPIKLTTLLKTPEKWRVSRMVSAPAVRQRKSRKVLGGAVCFKILPRRLTGGAVQSLRLHRYSYLHELGTQELSTQVFYTWSRGTKPLSTQN